MFKHPFIFQPGLWIGEGKLSFSYSPDQIRFYTKWQIEAIAEGKIHATQYVEKQGVAELLKNSFVFSDITSISFAVLLENDLFGSIQGKGILSETIIAWEFHDKQSSHSPNAEKIEGLEVYQWQDSGDYRFHAEYLSNDKLRTLIDGRVWKKSEN